MIPTNKQIKISSLGINKHYTGICKYPGASITYELILFKAQVNFDYRN